LREDDRIVWYINRHFSDVLMLIGHFAALWVLQDPGRVL
jgi:hypothetical protein